MGRVGRRAFVVGVSVALAQVAQLTMGCESTTGRRVSLESRVRGSVARGEPFLTDLGFTVALQGAELWIANILYLEGAALAGRFEPLSVAHAHPGHYEEGTVLGEMLAPRLVDLLAGETSLGIGGGISGQMRSARISCEHAVSPDPLAGSLVRLSGSASRDGAMVAFTADLDASHLADVDTGRPIIGGCPVTGGDVQADGTVRLVVSLQTWLDQVDFSLVDPSVEPVALAADEPPHRALARGIRKASSFAFAYEPASA